MDIYEKIQKLKRQKNAVILAHNYQIPEVQDIADFTGDSLGLSKQAASTDADVIVFCGVRFMAETAKILSPDKKVLLPAKDAGCPMAAMITAEDVTRLKQQYPNALVVSYVNTTAEVKAVSDYCCTSSNAMELVKSLPDDREILFVPDKNLGRFVKERTDKHVILWPGYCLTHAKITADDVLEAKRKYPGAAVMTHPECNKEVCDMSDELLSTGQMLSFAKSDSAKQFIVVTELGIVHTLKVQNPEKDFYPVHERAVCMNMKKINVEKILWSLEEDQFEVTLSDEVIKNARLALDRMLEVIPSK